MAQFRYIAKSRTGERQEGVLDAPDKRTLMALLGRKGLVPISVADAQGKAEPPPAEKPAAETAKTPDRKKDQKKKQEKATSMNDSDFNADEISALLNKEKAAGGGAKRSQEEAALGVSKPSNGSKLSLSEMDALRGQIQNNWSIIPGMADAADVRVQVKMQLDQNGDIIGEPEVTATGGSEAARRALAGGARRAIMKSRPFKGLPPEKYDAWSEVVVNFDPSQMM